MESQEQKAESEKQGSALTTVAWLGVAILTAMVCLFVLAHLPTLE